MSAAVAALPILMAFAALFAASRFERPVFSNLSWLVVAGGFALLTWADATVAMALGVAAAAGFIAVPAVGPKALRLRSAGYASVIPVALAVAALACVRDANTMWGGRMVLYAAVWGALAGALGSFLSAAGINRRPISMSIPVAMAGAVGAVLVAGTGRSSLPEAFYGISLRAGSEPLRWVLDPVPGFESGMTLAVAASAEQLQMALFVVAGLSVVATAVVMRRKDGLAKKVVGAITLAAGGLLAALPSIVSSLAIPASDPYAAEVKRRILTRRGGAQILDSGHFTSTSDVSVATADLAPEIVGLTLVVLLGVVTFVAMHRDAEEPDGTGAVLARDLLARGVAFLWAGWLLLLVVHNGFLGAPGMGSPGEWVFTGVCLAATGLVITTWETPTSAFGKALRELTPGIVAAAIFIAAGLAWRFGAIVGLSLGVF